MERARLQIIEPNGARRSQPIGSRPMIIGRDPECDVVIGYEEVSHHHAQLAFDGFRYIITDLGSTNGTFLDDELILPQTAIEWPTNLPVRIENIIFRLQLPATEVQTNVPAAFHSEPPSQSVAPSAGRITSFLEDNKTIIILLVVFALVGVACGCLGMAAAVFALLFS